MMPEFQPHNISKALHPLFAILRVLASFGSGVPIQLIMMTGLSESSFGLSSPGEKGSQSASSQLPAMNSSAACSKLHHRK
jgi:hypothetical protein